MPMHLKPTVLIAEDGTRYPGSVAYCVACESEEFEISFIEGQNHPHYHCVGCGTSFCGTWDGSQCTAPDTGTKGSA